MVSRYKVHDTQLFDDEVFMRTTTISSGLKSQNKIAKSVEKRVLDGKIVRKQSLEDKKMINEVYLDMNLEKLRSISDDDYALSSLLTRNSAFLTDQYLNVFFVNIELPEISALAADDYDNLNVLLTWGKNDVYVMPTLSFTDVNDRSLQKNYYSTFVTNMLSSKNSMVPGHLNVGMSVPSYFRHKDIENLFRLYEDDYEEPTFITVDFARAGIDDKKRMGIASKIISHYNTTNNEDYFLYGLNMRTFKRSSEFPISDELLVARRGFNGFGSPHYRPTKRQMAPTTELRQLGRVFVKDDYRFHPISESTVCDSFTDWAEAYDYQFDLSAPLGDQAGKIRTIMKKYNVSQENEELSEISCAIRKNDTDLLNERKTRGI